MAMKATPGTPRKDEAAPLNPQIKRSIDPSYHPRQDGSSPLQTTSVKVGEERNFWPVVWIVTAVAMVALTIYMLVG